MKYREFAKTGFKTSVIGMGTYYDPLWIASVMVFRAQIGRKKKVRALQEGLDSGINFIDTAEIYRSETIVADSIAGRKRDELFIATKVWSNHLKPDALVKACKRSLANLKTSYIDLYQIHFPDSRVPIRDTISALEKLVDDGLIRAIGISNFSFKQMIETEQALRKHEIASTQLNYSLRHRDIERDILPHCEREKIAMIAYYPLGHGKLANNSSQLTKTVSKNRGGSTPCTPSQVALSWLVSKSPAVFPIPRASNPDHVKENAQAAELELSKEDMQALEETHPV